MTSDRFRHDLSEEAVRAIVRAVLGHAESERWSDARREAEPLIEAQARQPLVADALVYLIAARAFDREHAAEIASNVFEAHADDYRLLGKLGEALECIYDARYLNAAPPSEPVFEAVARRLSQGLEGVDDPDTLPGVEAFHEHHPDIPIYTAAVDQRQRLHPPRSRRR